MVVERACADYTDFRIPGIVVTEKGTLIRYCECRRACRFELYSFSAQVRYAPLVLRTTFAHGKPPRSNLRHSP